MLVNKKQRKKKNMMKFEFWQLVSQLPIYSKVRSRVICELPGSIILPACLVLGFVDSSAVILLTHQYGQFEISFTIPKQRMLPCSLILIFLSKWLQRHSVAR